MKPYYSCPICDQKLVRGLSPRLGLTNDYNPMPEMHSSTCQFHYFQQVMTDGESNTVLVSVEISLGFIEIGTFTSGMGLEYQADIHDTLTIENYPILTRSCIYRLPSVRYQQDGSCVSFGSQLLVDSRNQKNDTNTLHLDQLFPLDFPTLTHTIKKAKTLLFFA
jgi:hypothetical protein